MKINLNYKKVLNSYINLKFEGKKAFLEKSLKRISQGKNKK
jgi:hypothetical protein